MLERPYKKVFEKPIEKKIFERPKTSLVAPRKSNLPTFMPVKQKKAGIFTSERSSILPQALTPTKPPSEVKALYE